MSLEAAVSPLRAGVLAAAGSGVYGPSPPRAMAHTPLGSPHRVPLILLQKVALIPLMPAHQPGRHPKHRSPFAGRPPSFPEAAATWRDFRETETSQDTCACVLKAPEREASEGDSLRLCPSSMSRAPPPPPASLGRAQGEREAEGRSPGTCCSSLLGPCVQTPTGGGLPPVHSVISARLLSPCTPR